MTLMTVSYGDRFNGDIGEKSIAAMLSRGITHYMGSEQASKVTEWAKKFVESEGREPTDEEKLAKRNEVQQAAWDALLAGTVGEGNRGPRGTPMETLRRQYAEQAVKDILAKAKITMPTGDKTIKFGDGSLLTRKDLIDRRLANSDHFAAHTKEAERELTRREKVAAKADGAEDLLSAIG